MWARLLLVSGALLAGCGQPHAGLEAGAADGSVDASPREGPDTAAEAAPEAAALPDASVPPEASTIEVELLAHLRFVEAMRVGSGAVIVAERIEDAAGESRMIRRVDTLTGELTVVTSDVQDNVIGMTLAAGHVVWAEYHVPCGSCPSSTSIRTVPLAGGIVDEIATLDVAPCALEHVAGWLWLVLGGVELRRISLETGAQDVLLPDVECPLASTDTQLFLIRDSGLATYDVASGTSTDLGVTQGGISFASRIADGFWYWSTGNTSSSIHRVALAGGSPEVVAQGALFPIEFEARTHLFWLEQGVGSCDGRIVRAGLDGSGAQTLAKACWPYAIGSDGQHVYYLENLGTNHSALRRAPL